MICRFISFLDWHRINSNFLYQLIGVIVSDILTHLPVDKMAAISQTIFSDSFSWMNSLYFDQNFPEVFSSGSNWHLPSIGVNNGLAPNRQQAIIWTNDDQIHWRINCGIRGKWVNTCPSLPWSLWTTLTHCGLVMPYGIVEFSHPWFS